MNEATMHRDLPNIALAPLGAPDLDRLLSDANEAVVYVDENWIVQYCNDVYLRNVGLAATQVVGRTPFEYGGPFDRSIFFETIELSRREARPKVTIGFSTLLNRWLMVRVFPVHSGILAFANDATETVIEQFQLAQHALKDTLTGLPNRLAMLHAIRPRLARGESFSLAVIGLNRFQTINDAQGFARGDLALLEIASRLQTNTLAGERLYRLTSDEFAFVTEGDAPAVRSRVRCLLAQTRRPLLLNGQVFVLGAAAGAVSAPADGDDAELLLRRAGLALHEAKRSARDDVVAYESRHETATRLRAELEAELREALDKDQFMLALQPKGCLNRQHVVGAEALIRWAHPIRGMVPPGDFLTLVHECGLMPEIDRWVLWRALSHARELGRRGLTLPISINLSVESLADVGLVELVRRALEETGVSPSLLEIEIPEGALMRDVATSATVLAALDELGVGISIDDFGTGYSSFAYLARFPVRTLKIDRSFVNDMTKSDASRTIVKGLIRMAHSLSLRVVAEGAETREQIAMLQRMRCDEVQGYGYARPMPFDQFCAFAQDNRQPVGPSAYTI